MIQAQLARTFLGASGPAVSRLCLGAVAFGNATDEREAEEIIALYRAAGGNFIDATGEDREGLSERIVGQALKKHTGSWIVAVKAAPRQGTGPAANGDWLRQAAEASIGRLGLGRLDLLYLPLDDERIRPEGAIEAIGEMIEAGIIGGWGVYDCRAWRIAELIRIADCLDVPCPIAAQPRYHPLDRRAEVDYLPACAHFAMGVVTSMPIDHAFAGEEQINGMRHPPYSGSTGRPFPRPEWRSMQVVEALTRYLRASGRSLDEFTLEWVLANRLVSSALIQPRSARRLEAWLAAAARGYAAEDEAFMNALIPSGHAVGNVYGTQEARPVGRLVN